jgi:NADPH-dependent 7-cyano-7-deazaguanine reductase QueF
MKESKSTESNKIEQGIGIAFLDHSFIKADGLKFYASQSKGIMTIETEEFGAVNPQTSNPETITLKIQYQLKGKTLVKESLFEYLKSFRNVGMNQDEVTLTIYDDVKKTIGHNQVTVTTFIQGNGGLAITCTESSSKGLTAGY